MISRWAEISGCKPNFLQDVFDGKWENFFSCEKCDKPGIMELAIRGGYPELVSSSYRKRASWFKAYLDNQIFFDMRNQWGLRQSSSMADVMTFVAASSSQLLNKQAIGRAIRGDFGKVERYLSALEAMYLVDYLYAWSFKDYDRPVLSPKLFCTDSGLMAYLLNIKKTSDILNSPEKTANEGGKLVETWVYNQLMPEIDLNPLWRINHFRSKTHEIDFLITGDNGHQLGIEVKSGETISGDDAKHLKWFKSRTSEKFTGVVLYAGNQMGSFGDDCYYLPMSALWSQKQKT